MNYCHVSPSLVVLFSPVLREDVVPYEIKLWLKKVMFPKWRGRTESIVLTTQRLSPAHFAIVLIAFFEEWKLWENLRLRIWSTELIFKTDKCRLLQNRLTQVPELGSILQVPSSRRRYLRVYLCADIVSVTIPCQPSIEAYLKKCCLVYLPLNYFDIWVGLPIAPCVFPKSLWFR